MRRMGIWGVAGCEWDKGSEDGRGFATLMFCERNAASAFLMQVTPDERLLV